MLRIRAETPHGPNYEPDTTRWFVAESFRVSNATLVADSPKWRHQRKIPTDQPGEIRYVWALASCCWLMVLFLAVPVLHAEPTAANISQSPPPQPTGAPVVFSGTTLFSVYDKVGSFWPTGPCHGHRRTSVTLGGGSSDQAGHDYRYRGREGQRDRLR